MKKKRREMFQPEKDRIFNLLSFLQAPLIV